MNEGVSERFLSCSTMQATISCGTTQRQSCLKGVKSFVVDLEGDLECGLINDQDLTRVIHAVVEEHQLKRFIGKCFSRPEERHALFAALVSVFRLS